MMLPRSSIGKLPVLLTNLITKKHLAATLSTVKKEAGSNLILTQLPSHSIDYFYGVPNLSIVVFIFSETQAVNAQAATKIA